MTDEQWVWLYIHMALDDEELLNGMCPKCRNEASSHKHCTRCGTTLSSKHSETFVNPNFDPERFERLSEEEDGAVTVNKNFDVSAYNKAGGD